MKISNPFKAIAEKYRSSLKNNQRLAHRIGSGLIWAGFASMLALSIATSGIAAPTLLVWGGIGASAATLLGGLQVKYTLSLFYIAEQEAKRKSNPVVRVFEPVAAGLSAKKEAATSFVRAARNRMTGKTPDAANNNQPPAATPAKKSSGPKG
ncbi:MAG: hypothetical protein RBS08_02205 [Bdellovibrionales bacterium]|nr:hypothetical protein [Bdellovibrionales bacterium]